MDNISPKFLKDSASIITPAITYNHQSLRYLRSRTRRPKDWQRFPLYKKNDKLEVGNYRPFSVLNTVSKILEKSVYVQIQKYPADF